MPQRPKSKPPTRDQPTGAPGPFMLSRGGTWLTVVAVITLYLSIVMVMPGFAMIFGAVGEHCSGGSGLVCGPTGQQVARLAPSAGATIGLVIAGLGSFLPQTKRLRALWLLLGYGFAALGVTIGYLIASTGY